MTPTTTVTVTAKGGGVAGQFGDTTYTKVFVGGLAWETQKDKMRKYFEQFGEILEAVVITDKNTGRSKGYGFVTFREPEAAMRACVDAAPVIDGRRAATLHPLEFKGLDLQHRNTLEGTDSGCLIQAQLLFTQAQLLQPLPAQLLSLTTTASLTMFTG